MKRLSREFSFGDCKKVSEPQRLQGRPLLSVVTIYKSNIEELISTGLSLSDYYCDWIIINGEVDSDREKLTRLNLRDFTYLDGPDDGIYEGMNKGLAVASTPYVWFLNAGDIANIDGLEKVIAKVCKNPKKSIWICRQINLETQKTSTSIPLPRISLKYGIKPIPHQATIFKTKKLKEIGGFDLSVGLIADQLAIYRCATKYETGTSREVISIFKGGGIGSRASTSSFEARMQNLIFGRQIISFTLLRRLKKLLEVREK